MVLEAGTLINFSGWESVGPENALELSVSHEIEFE